MARTALMRRLGPLACGVVLGAWATWSFAAVPATGTAWGEAGLQFRSAIGGTLSVDGPFHVWPPDNTGTGGVKLKGTQGLKLPSAAKSTINLGKVVTGANLAKVARAAGVFTGFGTALALTGLAYEGIQWAAGEWLYEEGDGSPIPGKLWGVFNVQGGSTSSFSCNSTAPCSFGVLDAQVATVCQQYTGGGGNVCADRALTVMGSNLRWTYNIRSSGGAWLAGFTVDASQYGDDPNPGSVRPATDGEVETALSNALASDPSKASAVAQAVAEFVPLEQWVKESAIGTGPASINGASTTTTTMTPAGTETAVQQRTYNLTYVGDTVNITESTTTTTTHADSSVTTTTSTTAPSGDGGEAPPEEPSDLCVEHPEASGCQELGENEDDTELEGEDRNVSFDSELSAAGSCPAAKSLTMGGRSYSLEWTPICDLASGVRPVVIAIAWLSAGAFVFMIGRGSTA